MTDRDIRQMHRPRQVMFDRIRKERGKRYELQIQRCILVLRDEIGTCPNIEIDIDITDKTPFLLDHIM